MVWSLAGFASGAASKPENVEAVANALGLAEGAGRVRGGDARRTRSSSRSKMKPRFPPRRSLTVLVPASSRPHL